MGHRDLLYRGRLFPGLERQDRGAGRQRTPLPTPTHPQEEQETSTPATSQLPGASHLARPYPPPSEATVSGTCVYGKEKGCTRRDGADTT